MTNPEITLLDIVNLLIEKELRQDAKIEALRAQVMCGKFIFVGQAETYNVICHRLCRRQLS